MYDLNRGYPRVVPYLLYPDPGAAAEWIAGVLGFTEALRFTDPAGVAQHVELVRGDAVLMLGLHGSRHGSTSSITLVFVDDVHALCAHAPDTGATVTQPATDHPWGLRQAVLADPQGQRWEITEHLQDVDPAGWGAVQSARLPG